MPTHELLRSPDLGVSSTLTYTRAASDAAAVSGVARIATMNLDSQVMITKAVEYAAGDDADDGNKTEVASLALSASDIATLVGDAGPSTLNYVVALTDANGNVVNYSHTGVSSGIIVAPLLTIVDGGVENMDEQLKITFEHDNYQAYPGAIDTAAAAIQVVYSSTSGAGVLPVTTIGAALVNGFTNRYVVSTATTDEVKAKLPNGNKLEVWISGQTRNSGDALFGAHKTTVFGAGTIAMPTNKPSLATGLTLTTMYNSVGAPDSQESVNVAGFWIDSGVEMGSQEISWSYGVVSQTSYNVWVGTGSPPTNSSFLSGDNMSVVNEGDPRDTNNSAFNFNVKNSWWGSTSNVMVVGVFFTQTKNKGTDAETSVIGPMAYIEVPRPIKPSLTLLGKPVVSLDNATQTFTVKLSAAHNDDKAVSLSYKLSDGTGYGDSVQIDTSDLADTFTDAELTFSVAFDAFETDHLLKVELSQNDINNGTYTLASTEFTLYKYETPIADTPNVVAPSAASSPPSLIQLSPDSYNKGWALVSVKYEFFSGARNSDGEHTDSQIVSSGVLTVGQAADDLKIADLRDVLKGMEAVLDSGKSWVVGKHLAARVTSSYGVQWGGDTIYDYDNTYVVDNIVKESLASADKLFWMAPTIGNAIIKDGNVFEMDVNTNGSEMAQVLCMAMVSSGTASPDVPINYFRVVKSDFQATVAVVPETGDFTRRQIFAITADDGSNLDIDVTSFPSFSVFAIADAKDASSAFVLANAANVVSGAK